MFLRLIPVQTSIDFLGKRRICIITSLLLLALTIVGLFAKGLNYGIDFSGGSLVQIQTIDQPSVGDLRSALPSGVAIQEYGSPDEFLIRIPSEEVDDPNEITETILGMLSTVTKNVEIRRVEFVGPQIGEELRKTGALALLFSMLAILVYISVRFEFRYAVGAIVALAHDIFLTVGVFVLLQKEVSLPVLAALLTIIGYSLNDTIVVFDRVRETRMKNPKKAMKKILNQSINEMLNRTLMTSLTTIVVLLALFLFGGEVIHDFAFTLIFGVLVGTYSSIYIAAPVVLAMEDYYQRMAKEMEEEKIGFKG
jgi:preprotein translocase subunit SecF